MKKYIGSHVQETKLEKCQAHSNEVNRSTVYVDKKNLFSKIVPIQINHVKVEILQHF